MFYQEIAGLPLIRRFASKEDTENAFLGDSLTQMELIHRRAVQAPETGRSISLGFAVDKLEPMIEKIKEKGVEVREGPYAHVRFFSVLDLNGLRIQFVERSQERNEPGFLPARLMQSRSVLTYLILFTAASSSSSSLAEGFWNLERKIIEAMMYGLKLASL